jgi:hypothetical protein
MVKMVACGVWSMSSLPDCNGGMFLLQISLLIIVIVLFNL